MANTSRLGSLLLLIACLAACGGKSFDERHPSDSGGGSSNEGGSDDVGGAGSASGGRSNSGGKATGGNAEGGSADDSCDHFADDAATMLMVNIVNQSSAPLYFGAESDGCGEPPLFAVEDESGHQLRTNVDCHTSCDAVRTFGVAGCPLLCRVPSALALPPGLTHSTTWSGLDYVDLKIPSACVKAEGADSCQQAQRVRPGTYTFSARAGSSTKCTTPSGMCEACMPRDYGCYVDSAQIEGDIRTASVTVQLDESYGVYPSTDEAAPAPGGSGATARAVVEIVFTD